MARKRAPQARYPVAARCMGARSSGAWVSHADTHGETDLVVIFESALGSHLALIENKIAADFQPEQAARYALRRGFLLQQGATSARTILLAPGAYMTRAGAEAFDDKISYEEVFDILRSQADPRSKFLAGTIDSAIKQYTSGYVPTPDALVSAMREGLWSVGSRIAPNLNFPKPGLRPGRSTWIYFTRASGFSREDLKRVTIAYKAERGQVDLQFSRTAAQDLAEKASALLDATMQIVPASNSASIRVNTPAIDFAGALTIKPRRSSRALRHANGCGPFSLNIESSCSATPFNRRLLTEQIRNIRDPMLGMEVLWTGRQRSVDGSRKAIGSLPRTSSSTLFDCSSMSSKRLSVSTGDCAGARTRRNQFTVRDRRGPGFGRPSHNRLYGTPIGPVA